MQQDSYGTTARYNNVIISTQEFYTTTTLINYWIRQTVVHDDLFARLELIVLENLTTTVMQNHLDKKLLLGTAWFLHMIGVEASQRVHGLNTKWRKRRSIWRALCITDTKTVRRNESCASKTGVLFHLFHHCLLYLPNKKIPHCTVVRKRDGDALTCVA